MIKSNLVKSKSSYPCLMETKSAAQGPYVVVMFSAECIGTIVHSADQTRGADAVGYHSNNYDMSHFQGFNGKIELGE